MATYLITGGAGFIGRHLCHELSAAGHQVRVLDSLIEQAHDQEPAQELAADEFLHADIRDPEAVELALDGVNGVFHLAAEVGVGQSMYEIERYISTNRSEEHTSELQSLMRISYAVFCLNKK